ncbi:hypothetical protein H4R35_001896 [Dimargaris xerosporica]|nr:hypothetical protein H4R35_001896 [Dimargaris xerosporica]
MVNGAARTSKGCADDVGDASDSDDNVQSDFSSWSLELSTLEDHGATSDEEDTSSRASHVSFKRNVEALSTQPGMMSYLSSMGSYILPTDLHRLFQSTLRLIYAFNQGLEMTNTELLSGLLILQKYHYIDAQFHPRALPNPLTTSLSQIEKWGHYCKYALASYGWRGLYFFGKGGRGLLVDSVSAQADSRGVKEYLGLPDDDLLAYEFRPTVLFQPSYFLAYDRAASALVLSIRGTMSTQDTLVDLVCEYQKWYGGLVHSGIKAAANWLMLNVMPKALAHMKRHKVTSLVIVGHSLGGSTAALLTMMLLEQLLPPEETPSPANSNTSDDSTQSPPRLQTPTHYEAKSSSISSRSAKFKVRCFVYGAAPCVSLNLIRRYRNYITCFVYRDDFVCRLSYGSVFDIKGMIMAAAEMADALPQEILRSGWQCPEQLLPWIHEHWPDRGVAFEAIADLEAALKHHGVPASSSDTKWLWRLRQLHQIRQEQHQDPHPTPKLYLPGQVYCLYPDSPPLTPSTITKALETTRSPILSHVYQSHPDGLQEPEPLHLNTPHEASSTNPSAMRSELPNITALVSSPLERALQSTASSQVSTPYSDAYPTAQTASNATGLSPYPRRTSTSLDSLVRPGPTPSRETASTGILDYFTQPFGGAPKSLTTAATTGTSLVKVQSRSPPQPPSTTTLTTQVGAAAAQFRESGPGTPFLAAQLSVSATSASTKPKPGPRTVVKPVTSDTFTELVIRPNMFPDHMPNVYEEAFARARESLMSGRVR